MPLVPMVLGEKLRIVNASTLNPNQRQSDKVAEEQFRVLAIVRRRRYVDGEQYDDENLALMGEMRIDPLTGRLPEHVRKHTYSTQIEESVNFVADQLGDAFEIVAEDGTVQDVIDAALQLSPQLSGSGDADDVSLVPVLADAITAGDVVVQLRWDPGEQSVFFDLWESEAVEIEWADRDTPEKVIIREMIWVENAEGDDEQKLQITVYTVETRTASNDAGEVDRIWQECRMRVWWDDQDQESDEPRIDVWTGFPFMPFGLIRPRMKGLRAQRGESLIKTQAMDAADRLNANEQAGWLIARYNSSGNLVVVGDAAHLQLEKSGALSTDVGDVVSFPGGTSVEAVKLDSDTQMIEHQLDVLAGQIYATFGLTRVEPDTIQGLGAVSGYALEILNRKTEGTFERIRRNVIRDLRVLFSKTLDLYDALVDEDGPTADSPEEAAAIADDGGLVPQWAIRLTDALGDEVDPDVGRFPNTTIEIRLGSGYIVDDVQVRDDYQARLISRREALRKRGYDDDDIDKIIKEIDEENVAANGTESGRFRTQAGRTTGQVDPPGSVPTTT